MFTKAIKKHIGFALVLTVCSASSMAADYEKTLTAAQYQPLVGIYSGAVYQGIKVTGTAVTGCAAPSSIFLPQPAFDVTSGAQPANAFDLFLRTSAMDMLTKAKAAGRPISVSYSTGGTPPCVLTSVIMK